MSGGFPYQLRRRPITSTVTKEEHARLAELAKRQNKPTTTYVTDLLRQHIAQTALENAHE